MKKIFCFTVLFLVLVGCSSAPKGGKSGPTPETPVTVTQLSGTLPGWESFGDASAFLAGGFSVVSDGTVGLDDSAILLSVSSDGSFTADLPSSSPSTGVSWCENFDFFSDVYAAVVVTSAPEREGAKGLGVYYYITQGGAADGAFQAAAWLYADRDTEFEGPCAYNGFEGEFFDVDLAQGWNPVVVSNLEPEEGDSSELKWETKPLPSGLAWRFETLE